MKFSYILSLTTLVAGSLAQNHTGSLNYSVRTETFTETEYFPSTTSESAVPTQTSATLLWKSPSLRDRHDGSGYYEDTSDEGGFSVVSADACSTVYQSTISGGPLPDTDVYTYTVIQSGSQYEEISAGSSSGSYESYHNTCSPDGTATLNCAGTYSFSSNGTQYRQTYSHTVLATLTPYTYPVTAGSAKLASATGTCTKHGNVAAPTGLTQEIYKVVIVPAAAVLAAALV